MKIIVDENIPFGREAFENFGKVELHNGREINASVCKNADALIVRSITKVNEELLDNSSIKFVGTATIGTDHINQNYLEKKEIAFSSAAGCNSYSVAEYVFSALTYFTNKYKFNLNNLSVGVVGYGNIGRKVAAIAEALGMRVVVNDPPLQRTTNERRFSTLEEALKCDVVTFHVPLNKSGIDKTVHLLNKENINLIKEDVILINSSRGPVVSNAVLKKRLESKNNIHSVIDVWETEPNYDSELLRLVNIGTPHIAGYSYEGKVNGTVMIYNALSKHLGINPNWKPKLTEVVDNRIECSGKERVEELLLKIFNKSYNIIEDDELMRQGLDLPIDKKIEQFDSLRKNYKIRRELSNFEVLLNSNNEKFRDLLKILRVKV
ncbi:MAG: 4-phosphoerythronate dehydrogenase [Melioribacteraceae bacterium]|nr:4-phosphoerythronate dehydrogenase [Melioribacteraceae bacterium]